MYTITKSTLIGDIMDNAPEVAPLFYSIGMYCLSCESSRGETLEEACQVHAVDTDAFLEQVQEWQKTCQDDPDAASQAAMLYSMFGMGDSFGGGDWSADAGFSADAWNSIDEELAAFGIGSDYYSFGSEFHGDETGDGPAPREEG